ncbi:MAG: hypothetical protein OXE87_11290 [Chloroflexi bacterium]|nr:hypothetical protein [Chloroflexota bacterium]
MAIELAAIQRSVPDAPAREVAFGVIGIGKEPSERYISGIFDRPPDAMILVGFCGGADPTLAPGDLHIARSFLNPDSSDAIDADPMLNARLSCAGRSAGGRVVAGTSTTVNTVAGRDAKMRLHETTGSASVNMEDYWVARAARSVNVPFASVRAVLDRANAEIPRYLSANPIGPARILTSLLIHPGRLPGLIRLARLVRTASNSLSRCVIAAIETLSLELPALPVVPK